MLTTSVMQCWGTWYMSETVECNPAHHVPFKLKYDNMDICFKFYKRKELSLKSEWSFHIHFNNRRDEKFIGITTIFFTISICICVPLFLCVLRFTVVSDLTQTAVPALYIYFRMGQQRGWVGYYDYHGNPDQSPSSHTWRFSVKI